VVFDGIVGAALEEPSDFFPFVAEAGVGGEEGVLLAAAPGFFGDGGAELVVPPGWKNGYLSRICLEVRLLGIRLFISAATVVHWLVPCWWISLRITSSSWILLVLPRQSTVFYLPFLYV
jgi:hypothetical protein